ncbi:signal transduction histidine kinase [Sphingobium fontiphilum]|uniref:histidine kinase n=1 Tax=Sphingobium fontiphilum TaxID=944425 RepID=A0A7W6GQ53_9SPHN|nr:HAMP domain-containing sensor histidine kinase [Sphingobium fontiphilum]MBB3981724.1 signal transduction histidine kinase [Sphingobium fontiphilum]
MLRFDDLAQTVLAAGDRRGAGAVTLWRQCVDLIAQRDRADRGGMDADERAALLERLAGLRDGVSETQRLATVVELGGRLRSASLVEFFAGDRPAVIAAALSRARLPETSWVAMLPRLSPTARGVLRARRDLGDDVRRALESFGATDLVLTSDVAVAPEMMLSADMAETVVDAPMAEVSSDPAFALVEPSFTAPTPPAPPADQIRHLVDRIEQFTSQRRDPAALAAAPSGPVPVRAFTFESDASGTIIWVGDGPRAALIGLNLAEPALAGGSGPDGHVAGAFARRSGFQNGRFTIVGGTMAGEWRLSATPFFDPRTGRFQGYRGQARRPHLHEVAAAPDQSAIFPGLSGDSLRQLVHELRTPLNAILGFAEIIEQELFGPAGVEYREMAGNIAVDARHLLAAFDDLDLAARVARGDGGGAAASVDAALLVSQVAARFAHGDAGRHGVDIAIAAELPPVRIDPVQGERMVQHLLRTLVSVAPVGEPVTGTCWFQPREGAGRVVMAVDRPSSLDGMEEAQLLDPGYTPDGDWPDGPLLGMGFSLRLIRSLAEGCGGALTIDGNRFLLSMPAEGAGDGHVGDTAY